MVIFRFRLRFWKFFLIFRWRFGVVFSIFLCFFLGVGFCGLNFGFFVSFIIVSEG